MVGRDPDGFLRRCRAVVHVGAHDGAECELYARHGLQVLWVEALPEACALLARTIQSHPRQRAVHALVTDREGADYDFHVSDNGGRSSSIFEFGEHAKLWPEVAMARTIRLRSTTLEQVVRTAGEPMDAFDALVLDVQGAELAVIEGAGAMLAAVRFIKAEAADFPAYRGACTLDTLSRGLGERGFVARSRHRFAGKRGVGACYDVIYERRR